MSQTTAGNTPLRPRLKWRLRCWNFKRYTRGLYKCNHCNMETGDWQFDWSHVYHMGSKGPNNYLGIQPYMPSFFLFFFIPFQRATSNPNHHVFARRESIMQPISHGTSLPVKLTRAHWQNIPPLRRGVGETHITDIAPHARLSGTNCRWVTE